MAKIPSTLYVAEGSLLLERGKENEGRRQRLPGDTVTVGKDITEDMARELLAKPEGQGARLSTKLPELTPRPSPPPVHETEPLLEDLREQAEVQRAQIAELTRQLESLKKKPKRKARTKTTKPTPDKQTGTVGADAP